MSSGRYPARPYFNREYESQPYASSPSRQDRNMNHSIRRSRSPYRPDYIRPQHAGANTSTNTRDQQWTHPQQNHPQQHCHQNHHHHNHHQHRQQHKNTPNFSTTQSTGSHTIETKDETCNSTIEKGVTSSISSNRSHSVTRSVKDLANRYSNSTGKKGNRERSGRSSPKKQYALPGSRYNVSESVQSESNWRISQKNQYALSGNVAESISSDSNRRRSRSPKNQYTFSGSRHNVTESVPSESNGRRNSKNQYALSGNVAESVPSESNRRRSRSPKNQYTFSGSRHNVTESVQTDSNDNIQSGNERQHDNPSVKDNRKFKKNVGQIISSDEYEAQSYHQNNEMIENRANIVSPKQNNESGNVTQKAHFWRNQLSGQERYVRSPTQRHARSPTQRHGRYLQDEGNIGMDHSLRHEVVRQNEDVAPIHSENDIIDDGCDEHHLGHYHSRRKQMQCSNESESQRYVNNSERYRSSSRWNRPKNELNDEQQVISNHQASHSIIKPSQYSSANNGSYSINGNNGEHHAQPLQLRKPEPSKNTNSYSRSYHTEQTNEVKKNVRKDKLINETVGDSSNITLSTEPSSGLSSPENVSAKAKSWTKKRKPQVSPRRRRDYLDQVSATRPSEDEQNNIDHHQIDTTHEELNHHRDHKDLHLSQQNQTALHTSSVSSNKHLMKHISYMHMLSQSSHQKQIATPRQPQNVAVVTPPRPSSQISEKHENIDGEQHSSPKSISPSRKPLHERIQKFNTGRSTPIPNEQSYSSERRQNSNLSFDYMHTQDNDSLSKMSLSTLEKNKRCNTLDQSYNYDCKKSIDSKYEVQSKSSPLQFQPCKPPIPKQRNMSTSRYNRDHEKPSTKATHSIHPSSQFNTSTPRLSKRNEFKAIHSPKYTDISNNKNSDHIQNEQSGKISRQNPESACVDAHRSRTIEDSILADNSLSLSVSEAKRRLWDTNERLQTRQKVNTTKNLDDTIDLSENKTTEFNKKYFRAAEAIKSKSPLSPKHMNQPSIQKNNAVESHTTQHQKSQGQVVDHNHMEISKQEANRTSMATRMQTQNTSSDLNTYEYREQRGRQAYQNTSSHLHRNLNQESDEKHKINNARLCGRQGTKPVNSSKSRLMEKSPKSEKQNHSESSPLSQGDRTDESGSGNNTSIAELVAKLASVKRDDPSVALKVIDSILQSESRELGRIEEGRDMTKEEQGRGITSFKHNVHDAHRIDSSQMHGVRVSDEEFSSEYESDSDDSTVSNITDPTYQSGFGDTSSMISYSTMSRSGKKKQIIHVKAKERGMRRSLSPRTSRRSSFLHSIRSNTQGHGHSYSTKDTNPPSQRDLSRVATETNSRGLRDNNHGKSFKSDENNNFDRMESPPLVERKMNSLEKSDMGLNVKYKYSGKGSPSSPSKCHSPSKRTFGGGTSTQNTRLLSVVNNWDDESDESDIEESSTKRTIKTQFSTPSSSGRVRRSTSKKTSPSEQIRKLARATKNCVHRATGETNEAIENPVSRRRYLYPPVELSSSENQGDRFVERHDLNNSEAFGYERELPPEIASAFDDVNISFGSQNESSSPRITTDFNHVDLTRKISRVEEIYDNHVAT